MDAGSCSRLYCQYRFLVDDHTLVYVDQLSALVLIENIYEVLQRVGAIGYEKVYSFYTVPSYYYKLLLQSAARV